MEERSLDEFVESVEDDSASDGDEQTVTESDDNRTAPNSGEDDQTSPDSDASERVLPESVEPAAVTSRVVPGGTACEGCGTQVSRLWTGEDGERCRDCKEW